MILPLKKFFLMPPLLMVDISNGMNKEERTERVDQNKTEKIPVSFGLSPSGWS